MNDIKGNIIAKIQSGETTMRPRWHFVLKAILTVASISFVAFALVYIASFLFFVLIQTGTLFMPAFGMRGIVTFLIATPWALVVLALICVFALELLVRHYSVGYRNPLLYTIAGILLFVFLGTLAVANTTMHQRFMQSAEEGALPVIGTVYRSFGAQEFEDMYIGTVEEITDEGFVITTRRGESKAVIVSEETRIQRHAHIEVQDEVIILGEEAAGEIEAAGVRAVPTEGIFRKAEQAQQRLQDGNGGRQQKQQRMK